MIGSVYEVDNNNVFIKLLANINQGNLINQYLVMSSANKLIVGEVMNVKQDSLQAKLIGEIINV